ncbi:MAG TPA: hypothetical protein VF134_08085 [Candidatus Dormibacteraeota bacterium]
MIERLLILLALAALLAAAIWIARRWPQRPAPPEQVWEVLGEEPDGRPLVVTFSGPRCAECTIQKRIARGLGDHVRTLEIDAARQPGVASSFGVLTVPTTVVVRADGSVAAVNRRLVQKSELEAQLLSRS